MKAPVLFLLATASACAALPAPEVSLQSRVGYDSNPVGASGTAAAVWGDQGTFTEAISTGLGLTLASSSPANASLKLIYTGEATRFDRWEGEDYSTHRLGLSGKFTVGPWDFTGDVSTLFVAGDDDTLTSVPSVNANAVTLWRERREQWQHRAKLQAQALLGHTLVRVSAKLLAYDYQTNVVAGKVAFANRLDANGGVDVGWKQSADSLWLAGVRVGQQHQATIPLPGSAFDYSSTYTRLLLGWEGKPFAGTTLNIAAGPDFRRYTGNIDTATFTGGGDRTSLWFEGGFTSKLADTVTLTGSTARMVWLSSTGKAAYTDTCVESFLSWACTPTFSLRLMGKLHRCDYFPVARDDSELFVGPGATLKLSKRTTLTLDVLRHDAWNNLSDYPEREFQRVVVNLGVGVKF